MGNQFYTRTSFFILIFLKDLYKLDIVTVNGSKQRFYAIINKSMSNFYFLIFIWICTCMNWRLLTDENTYFCS